MDNDYSLLPIDFLQQFNNLTIDPEQNKKATESLVVFLQQFRLLHSQLNCSKCGSSMNLGWKQENYRWMCPCRTGKSVREGSLIFSLQNNRNKLSLYVTLRIFDCFIERKNLRWIEANLGEFCQPGKWSKHANNGGLLEQAPFQHCSSVPKPARGKHEAGVVLRMVAYIVLGLN
jgi:hypothetical protein